VTRPVLSEFQQEVFQKIKVLRDYTAQTGFKTTRSQKEIFGQLSGDDLAAVLLALQNEGVR
jgi:hypothetical protein